MKVIEVDINSVRPNTWNPNVQSEFVFEKNKKSLDDEKQLIPILVRENDGLEIVDGEHRWRAAKELGWKKIAVNNLGKISDAKAILIGQKLNRISGTDDRSKLKDAYEIILIDKDYSREIILQQLPVLDHELDALMKEVDETWAEMPSSPKEEKKDEESEDGEWAEVKLRVPIEIKEQFDEQMERFKKLLYPNDESKDVSPVMPFEAMIQVLAQTPDSHVMGGQL